MKRLAEEVSLIATGVQVESPKQRCTRVKGVIYTSHEVTTSIKISEPGTIYALSLCNIHGLWEGATEITLS